MNILINGLQLNEQNSGVQCAMENTLHGIGKLAEEGARGYRVLLSKNYSGRLQGNSNFKLTNVHFDSRNRIRRVAWEHIILPALLKAQKDTIYHAPAYILPYYCPVPSVVTIHDLIALQFPELCKQESKIYFGLTLPRTIKQADKIITVSLKVKEDILANFRVEPDKIHVAHLGINKSFKRIEEETQRKVVTSKYDLPEKYILFLGNLEPKKNLVRLLEAFWELKKTTNIAHQLVIAGKRGWKYQPIYKTIRERKLEDDVKLIGYVANEHLAALYSSADLFVFPSIYEGFGLPALEAMACGTPVLVSNRGSLPEVTGSKCLSVNPYNIAEMAGSMYKLLTDVNLRQYCIQEGFQWVKPFTWERTAQETLQVYSSLIDDYSKK